VNNNINKKTFGILTAMMVVAIVAIPLNLSSIQQADAVPDNKDFCLTAENQDETISDCANTKQTCKSLITFYESEGYRVTEKCKPVYTGE